MIQFFSSFISIINILLQRTNAADIFALITYVLFFTENLILIDRNYVGTQNLLYFLLLFSNLLNEYSSCSAYKFTVLTGGPSNSVQLHMAYQTMLTIFCCLK